MPRLKGNRRIDAATTLVGWTNRSATRDSDALTVVLHLAPLLRDGSMGTFVPVATVAVPAEGSRVEACISGHDIHPNAADIGNADLPGFCFPQALVTPSTPEGMVVGLTATLPD